MTSEPEQPSALIREPSWGQGQVKRRPSWEDHWKGRSESCWKNPPTARERPLTCSAPQANKFFFLLNPVWMRVVTSLSFNLFFLMWTIFKLFNEFVTIFLTVSTFWLFWRWGMWDLSFLTRDQTHIPYIGRRSLNHWTAREVPHLIVLIEQIYVQRLGMPGVFSLCYSLCCILSTIFYHQEE